MRKEKAQQIDPIECPESFKMTVMLSSAFLYVEEHNELDTEPNFSVNLLENVHCISGSIQPTFETFPGHFCFFRFEFCFLNPPHSGTRGSVYRIKRGWEQIWDGKWEARGSTSNSRKTW